MYFAKSIFFDMGLLVCLRMAKGARERGKWKGGKGLRV